MCFVGCVVLVVFMAMMGLGCLLWFTILQFMVVVCCMCCGLPCWLLFRFVLLFVNSVDIVVYTV